MEMQNEQKLHPLLLPLCVLVCGGAILAALCHAACLGSRDSAGSPANR